MKHYCEICCEWVDEKDWDHEHEMCEHCVRATNQPKRRYINLNNYKE